MRRSRGLRDSERDEARQTFDEQVVLSEPPRERVFGQRSVADRIKNSLDTSEVSQAAVILCPDASWQLALMKFILEQSLKAFPTNVRDLNRRGLFDPEAKERDRTRREIEHLFADATSSPQAREALGKKLQEYGLFEEYQDRFFSLIG